MAESAVAQPTQRFYCHKCNVEIENVSSVSCLQIKHKIFMSICNGDLMTNVHRYAVRQTDFF